MTIEQAFQTSQAAICAVKTILECLVGTQPTHAPQLSRMLAAQAAAQTQAGMHIAAEIVQELSAFVVDPERAKFREEIGKLLKAQPKGSA